MGKRQRRLTWARLFAQRVGSRRAARVVAFLATYYATEQELGHAPSMEEYAKDWGISPATAYRDLALFREAQPFFEQPGGFTTLVGGQVAGFVPQRLLGEVT